jgi:hypothetical protein
MLNWFRNWKTRRERKNWHFACPARLGPMTAHLCEEWASKENVDRALVMPKDGYLTCEKCGKTSPLLYWRTTGQARSLREMLKDQRETAAKA